MANPSSPSRRKAPARRKPIAADPVPEILADGNGRPPAESPVPMPAEDPMQTPTESPVPGNDDVTPPMPDLPDVPGSDPSPMPGQPESMMGAPEFEPEPALEDPVSHQAFQAAFPHEPALPEIAPVTEAALEDQAPFWQVIQPAEAEAAPVEEPASGMAPEAAPAAEPEMPVEDEELCAGETGGPSPALLALPAEAADWAQAAHEAAAMAVMAATAGETGQMRRLSLRFPLPLAVSLQPSEMKTIDTLTSMTRHQADAVLEAGRVVASAAEIMARQSMEYGQRLMSLGLSTGKALTEARTLRDYATIGNGHVHRQLDETVAQGGRVAALALETTREAMRPLTQHVSESLDQLAQLRPPSAG